MFQIQLFRSSWVSDKFIWQSIMLDKLREQEYVCNKTNTQFELYKIWQCQ